MGRCTILSCTVSDDSAPTTWESGAWSQNSPSSLDCGGYPPSGSEYSSNNRKYVLRVGCAFMAKKMETMQSIIKPRTKDTHRSSKEATAAPTHGGVIAVDDMSVLFQTIQLDDDVPLEAQGRFDVILHKLSEDVFNRASNAKSRARLKLIEDYLRDRPNCIILDPFDSVQLVTNRANTLKILQTVAHEKEKMDPPQSALKSFPLVPPSVVMPAGTSTTEIIERVREECLSYPVICKPVHACGSAGSHSMKIVLNEPSLNAICDMLPAIVQEYRNHHGRLFKVTVIGDRIHMHERASFPDLSKGLKGVIPFNSQLPYPDLSHHIGTMEDHEPACMCNEQPTAVSSEQAELFAHSLKSAFKLTLFGFDLIVDCTTKDILCIDVNYFPSFRDTKDFPLALKRHLISAAYRKNRRSDNNSNFFPLLAA
eukprot:26448_1